MFECQCHVGGFFALQGKRNELSSLYSHSSRVWLVNKWLIMIHKTLAHKES